MLKRLLVSGPAAAFCSALAVRYIRFVYATSAIAREPQDSEAKLFAEHPQILAMWHGQFLLLPQLKPERPAEVRAMVSRHGDAAVIGAVLERFGMRLIRGAGAGKRRRNRGGAAALRESLRALAGGATVAMTADVPPGPARRAGKASPCSPRCRGARWCRWRSLPGGASRCPAGAPSPSTSPSPGSPSWSAIRSRCRRPTTPKRSKRGVLPSRRLSPRRPLALMLWLEPEIL